ncbi:protein N-lysine methyltransferase METTL21A [Carex littledalei]|uniref:Protein N-lysine methyltransferase METTL21A n=1 Tax=Carex littledalei TaxID=544730 RepID=A0A833VD43_9POAL|nr:protein N-lysine methyltransferase METTL21A [Carex littledalei]
MDPDRLNSPSTSAIAIEAFGHGLHISQDPNSKHLGMTVWDASMVLVKYLEKNSRKGRFSPAKMKGKRVIELGAGCGLAGLGMALLGCDVTLTDQLEVLPLLTRNVDRNKSWISQGNSDSGSFGSISVAELDWGNKTQIEAVGPPFDYIIGTDVVYAEHLLEPLIETILALSGPSTIVLIGHEIRCTTVHEQMIEMLKNHFIVRTIPKSKMDIKYQHPSIQLYMMELKARPKCNIEPCEAINKKESSLAGDEEGEACDCGETQNAEPSTPVEFKDLVPETGKLDDWEIRRCGAMAARLLRDVKLT